MELTFDRGTLLVHPSPRQARELVAHQVLHLAWDPRVAAWRGPAHRYAEIRATLARRFGDDLKDRVREAVLQLESGRRGTRKPRAPALRPYQESAVDAWVLSGRRGLVVLPTGAGKTHVALAAFALVGRPALVLVPTRVLLHQWADRVRELCCASVGIVGDGTRTLGPVTICTFESAYRHLDRFGDRFALLVVDEVHHFARGMRAEALEMCTAPARLGLTATPPSDPEALERLADLLGPIVYRRTIGDLSGRYLAPFEHVLLPVELTEPERIAYENAYRPFALHYREYLRTTLDPTWIHFVEMASRTAEGRRALVGHRTSRRIVSVAEEKVERVSALLARHADEPALVFTADNSAAYLLSRKLLAPALTCDIGRTERMALLARFREGGIRALISSRVLNEGIDLPECRVGIIVGGSHGSREQVQRVGRLLRPRAGKIAVVLELVARHTFEVGQSRRRRRALIAGLTPSADSCESPGPPSRLLPPPTRGDECAA